MPTKVIMPQLGESVVEGTVSKWLKNVGDHIAEFEPLLEVSTDKVDTEIPSPAEGVVLKIYVPEGTTVERGVLLAMIGQPGEVPSDSNGSTGDHAHHAVGGNAHGNVVNTPAVTQAVEEVRTESAQRFSPVVARMAAEHSIDLTKLKGTGMGGRVTKKDVESYLASKSGGQTQSAAQKELEPWEQPISGDLFKPTEEIFANASGKTAAKPAPAAPAPTPSAAPKSVPAPAAQVPVQQQPAAAPQGVPGELVPFSPMRKIIAEHMVRSKLHTAPHVTTVFEVDMSKTMAHWKANMDAFAKNGLRLTLTAYFIAAIVKASQAHPTLNSQWTDEGLFMHHNVNVGMAVALQEGLIVPVIKNAQDLNLSGLARQVNDLANRARNRGLKADETQGGTITLTNHGVSGSLMATPVINQPQSAIVGVGAVKKQVVVIEETDAMVIRPMMYATLTFDHRVADGAVGDAFMRVFKETLENWA